MFSCEVKEFSNAVMYEVVNDRLYYQDSYFFYDENLHPLHPVPNLYNIFYADNGAWIETKDDAGKITSKHLSFIDWKIDSIKNHRYSSDAKSIDNKIYFVDGRRKDTRIVCCVDDKEFACVNIPKMDRTLNSHNNLVYGFAEKTVYCFDSLLNSVWAVELDDEVISMHIEFGSSDDKSAVLIVYFGSDSTCYGFRAYGADTGTLVWEKKVAARAAGIQYTGGKIYFCSDGSFIRLNSLTGYGEIDQPLFFERSDGHQVPIISAFPINNRILCFYDENFIEIRTDNVTDILQKITLPESSYIFPSDPNVLAYSGQYYIGLGHQVFGLNPMKSAVAILSPDDIVSDDHQAFFESRPPYTVAPIKDKLGKNAYFVRMEGDDENKIIRYACVVLKELAFKSGVTRFFEFETRDKNNAGLLSLEINTSQLQASGVTKNWNEIFTVIKDRTESELKDSHVLAGDGESYFQVELCIS